ncbi:MAG TPA: protein kinase [Terrimicrobiaceae bacterium]
MSETPHSSEFRNTRFTSLGTEDSSAEIDVDFGQTIFVRRLAEGQKAFNRYLLRRELGRGAMGVVWLAWDEKLEREVALKFLPEIVRADPAAVDELKRETRRSLQLTHSSIVRVYDFLEDDSSAAIAMEYIDGATLSALRIERERRFFEVEEIRTWMKDLCAAVHFAHSEARVVHRDLKPANLMVDRSGRLKVTDFGIARSISDSVSRISFTVSTTTSGSLAYMSPQQAMGDPPVVSDDVYSIGATIYELLTGKTPFHSGNMVLQLREKVPPPITTRRSELGLSGEGIPDAWERTVAACLAKPPEERPTTVADIWKHLDPSGSELRKTDGNPPKFSYRTVFVIAGLLALVAGWSAWRVFTEQPGRGAEPLESTQQETGDQIGETLAGDNMRKEDVAAQQQQEAAAQALAAKAQAEEAARKQEEALRQQQEAEVRARAAAEAEATAKRKEESMRQQQEADAQARAKAEAEETAKKQEEAMRQQQEAEAQARAKAEAEETARKQEEAMRQQQEAEAQARAKAEAETDRKRGQALRQQQEADEKKLQNAIARGSWEEAEKLYAKLLENEISAERLSAYLGAIAAGRVEEAGVQTKRQESGKLDISSPAPFDLDELCAAGPYADLRRQRKEEMLKAVQNRLKTLNFFAMEADGIPSVETQKALIAFQRKVDIPASGRLDFATVTALDVAGRESNTPARTVRKKSESQAKASPSPSKRKEKAARSSSNRESASIPRASAVTKEKSSSVPASRPSPPSPVDLLLGDDYHE